jgi:hypothetical protein
MEALKAVGLGDASNTIMSAFHDMEIAEEVIAAEKRRYPRQAELIDTIFIACKPPEELPRTAPAALYRLHVKQLIAKLLRSERLDTPTHVECVCIGLRMSELAPLPPRLYDWLLSDAETCAVFGVGTTQTDEYNALRWYSEMVRLYRQVHGDARQRAYDKRMWS